STAALFEQSPDTMLNNLIAGDGMIIALPETDKRIRIVAAQPYPKSMVGERYKKRGIENMEPGDLWSPSMRTIKQSLIVAKDEDGVGGCVRLLAAEYWDPTRQRFVSQLTTGEGSYSETREGDIANYFGLERYERSRLQFLDESNTLYLVRGAYDVVGREDQEISPEEANRELEKFLKEE
ncbi:MAG: hypothetical protein AAB583_02905, partial [Patescibacteria group bacterium]